MRWSEDRILTIHTGSLPRPPELTRLYVRRARGGEVDPAELDRLGKEALRQIVDKQAEAGIDIGNNGEQQREAFFLYVRHRMSGFGSGWKRWPRGDVERYPLLKQQMAEALAAREAVSNMDPPKAVGEVRYIDDSELKSEIADFRAVLDRKPNAFVEPFLTAPSNGICHTRTARSASFSALSSASSTRSTGRSRTCRATACACMSAGGITRGRTIKMSPSKTSCR